MVKELIKLTKETEVLTIPIVCKDLKITLTTYYNYKYGTTEPKLSQAQRWAKLVGKELILK